MKQWLFIVVITLMIIGGTFGVMKTDVTPMLNVVGSHNESVSDPVSNHIDFDFMARYVEFDQSGGGVLVLAAFLFVTTSGLTLVLNYSTLNPSEF